MIRYNIALLPKTKSQEFINLAAPLSTQADYLLGPNSYPHITLAQFNVENDYNLDAIWQEVVKIQNESGIERRNIYFNQVYAKVDGNYVWLGLLIKNNVVCQQLHEKIATALQQMNITCLNASFDQYMPHLTLARTTDLAISDSFTAMNVNYNNLFYLALGVSDEKGQLIKIIKTHIPPTPGIAL